MYLKRNLRESPPRVVFRVTQIDLMWKLIYGETAILVVGVCVLPVVLIVCDRWSLHNTLPLYPIVCNRDWVYTGDECRSVGFAPVSNASTCPFRRLSLRLFASLYCTFVCTVLHVGQKRSLVIPTRLCVWFRADISFAIPRGGKKRREHDMTVQRSKIHNKMIKEWSR